jgi:hypothetical protein
MGAATVTIQAGLPGGPVMGKYVCASTVSLSYVNIGFVPRMVQVINATDKDVGCTWTNDMTAAHGMTDAGAAITSGGISVVAQTDGTNHGFSVGTDASVQEALKTYNFIAWR